MSAAASYRRGETEEVASTGRSAARGASPGEVQARFRETYQWELDQAWSEWKSFPGG